MSVSGDSSEISLADVMKAIRASGESQCETTAKLTTTLDNHMSKTQTMFAKLMDMNAQTDTKVENLMLESEAKFKDLFDRMEHRWGPLNDLHFFIDRHRVDIFT